MAHSNRPSKSGREPQIGGRQRDLSGMEPALSENFQSEYGRFQVEGLEAPPVSGRRRPLVVLATFEESTLELVSLLAESNGYDVRHAADGRTALRKVRALEPNLLVTSLRLPHFDGLSLVRRIRADRDPLVAKSAVLIMDVRYGHDIVMDAFESGADDYLEMPYEVPLLLRAWRRVCGYLMRPAPLTAMMNPDNLVRETALTYLLKKQPDGLVTGLGDLLWQPDPDIRAAVRGTLARLGTEEARAVLARNPQASEDKEGAA